VNGCGPEGAPQAFITALNLISANTSACNIHDYEYMTLGISKYDADMNLYRALSVGTFSRYQPTINTIFWAAVAACVNSSRW
jgi:hypothetical protein